jgi:AbrB family looped-hinge helix DNA binding protein
MDVAKVTVKGQVTIPQEVREKMNLKTGDKVVFFEQDGRCWLQNSAELILTDFQAAMKGKAKKTGLNSLAAVVKYIKKIRKTKN